MNCEQPVNLGDASKAINELRTVCRNAWKEGMMSGFSGNASIRLAHQPQYLAITAAGSSKGSLKADQCLVVDLDGRLVAGFGKPSSETAMHLAIYRACPECMSILHSHPVHLQALEILGREKGALETLPLFEARIWAQKLSVVQPLPPGSLELSKAAGSAVGPDAQLPCGIWLEAHGLCALGKTLLDCLCLAEELEHLAKISLLCRLNMEQPD